MKDIAWNKFKQTGDINAYLEFKGMEKYRRKYKGKY